MAIQVAGTTVISNTRGLSNIESLDATTIATINANISAGDITGVTAGTGLSGGGTSGTVTLNHADTSSQASVNNSGATVIQDVTLDTYGHITALGSATITPALIGAATSAQGTLADSATQPGDNISTLTNDAGYTTNIGDITGVTAGSGLTGGGTSGAVTVSHADTSSQASVNNSDGTVIQGVTLDTYGHVTGLTSYNLDSRYYTETEADSRFVNVSGDTMTGDLTIPDKIIHSGDTNTAIRFPSNDTVTVETSGSERMRIDSTGNVGIGTSSPAEKLEVNGTIKASAFLGATGRLIAIQKYDTAGSYTYTPTAGTARIIVEIVGAGGGGGGADGDTGDSDVGVGGGGGGGGYGKVYANVTASSYAVVIGAGGAGGTQSTDGSSGASSTFTSNGDSGAALTITATGGDGAVSMADRSDADISPGGNGGGFNSAGSSILFELMSEGSSGGHGWVIPSDELVGSGLAIAGYGGFNQLCEMETGPFIEVDGDSKRGGDGNRFGAGGTGAAALGNTVAQYGGNGAPGGVIIYEYSE